MSSPEAESAKSLPTRYRSVRTALRSRVAAVRRALPVEGRYVVRIVVTAAVAWQVCIWLGAVHPPVYAVVVPLVALRDAPYSAFNVSFARLVGVVAGFSIGIGVLSVLQPGLLSVTLVPAVALVAAIAFRPDGGLNVQVAASALLVFANPTPSSYAATRLWETAVGAAVTVVLAPLLLPTNPVRTFLADRARAAADLVAILREAGRLAADDPESMERESSRLAAAARDIEDDARELGPNLTAARRGVRCNPLWKRHVGRLPEQAAVEPIFADVAAMTRLFVDELAEMSGRQDARTWWSSSGALTVRVAEPLADAVEARLTGRRNRDAEERAQGALHGHIDGDGSRFGAVIRRPLGRIVLLFSGAV